MRLLYACVIGLALASASALPSRHLLDKKDRIKKFIGDSGDQDESGSKENTRTNYQFAHASCSVSTYSDSYSGYKDAFIDAVVKIWKHVCSSGWDYDYVYKHMYGWAETWASATAEAYVDCYSDASEDGHAHGCGFGEAAADASNFAFASAYAKAAVDVIDKGYCECGKSEIWTQVSADLFQVITAKAWAKVKAAACVEGANSYASAYAWVDCYADVWTQLYAEAIAHVYIDGYCGNNAHVSAWLDSFSLEYERCEFTLSSTPGARAQGRGGAHADS